MDPQLTPAQIALYDLMQLSESIEDLSRHDIKAQLDAIIAVLVDTIPAPEID